jgi:hypothetical protein
MAIPCCHVPSISQGPSRQAQEDFIQVRLSLGNGCEAALLRDQVDYLVDSHLLAVHLDLEQAVLLGHLAHAWNCLQGLKECRRECTLGLLLNERIAVASFQMPGVSKARSLPLSMIASRSQRAFASSR